MRPAKMAALWELGMWETALRMNIMVVNEWREREVGEQKLRNLEL